MQFAGGGAAEDSDDLQSPAGRGAECEESGVVVEAVAETARQARSGRE
ncbi:hypothetical protein [Streptomyces virginiae]